MVMGRNCFVVQPCLFCYVHITLLAPISHRNMQRCAVRAPTAIYFCRSTYTAHLLASAATTTMHRPSNRHPCAPRNNQGYRGRGGGGGGGNRGENTGRGGRSGTSSSWPRAPGGTPQQAAGTVPPERQVVTGAAVFVVLKQDQPTGREMQGIVQDVLSHGNHPRGMKVRLRSGQVGRVQRMDDRGSSGPPSEGSGGGGVGGGGGAVSSSSSRFTMRYTDVRREEEEFPSEPPPRGLADFMPTFGELPEESVRASLQGYELDNTGTGAAAVFAGAVAKCPFCEAFEGDEAAVTYHIDQEHLT
jgi:uncharacterized repeat protein (TIGR03833 family)